MLVQFKLCIFIFDDWCGRSLIWRQHVMSTSHVQRRECLHSIVDRRSVESGMSSHRLMLHTAARFSLYDQFFRSDIAYNDQIVLLAIFVCIFFCVLYSFASNASTSLLGDICRLIGFVVSSCYCIQELYLCS